MSKTLRALIVEDSENDALLMVLQLKRGGYDPVYELVSTPEEMTSALERQSWDIIFADFSMPHFSGLAALNLLKEKGLDVPFIIVSGVIGEETAVEAMKAGAHDYLMKGNLTRLLPAVERELREAEIRRDRRRAEEALRESEKRFRLVVERAADALFLHDMNGKFIDVNRQACESLGYTRDELLTRSVQDVEVDLDAIKLGDLWNAIMQKGPETIYGTHRRKDGTTFPVEVRVGLFEAQEPRLVLALARDITERKKAEAQITESLREKEVLLKEIHHRVKNNLQVIHSLLSLQSEYVMDSRAVDMFRECRNRVKSMALVHEVLYQSKDLARVNFSEYIRSLAASLFRSFGTDITTVGLGIDVDNVGLEIDTAIPCGLIINELISNALKYAFPGGRSGKINVKLHTNHDNLLLLDVEDDGVGLPSGMDFRKTQTLGLQLVTMLTDQLAGRVELDNTRGAHFKITFPGQKPKKGGEP